MIAEEQLVENEHKSLIGRILISCVLLIFIGWINSLWRMLDYGTWYEELIKPSFAPSPRWIVGAIWTLMYVTMGVAVGKMWQIVNYTSDLNLKSRAQKGILIFWIQILVNMCVPVFFFYFNDLHLVLLGVIVNLLLLLLIIRSFYQINKFSAYILLPYLVWLIYATLLDVSFVMLN